MSYEAYWELVRLREQARDSGHCTCCVFIADNGVRRDNPAVVRWTTKAHNREFLCESCYAMWSRVAATDKDLEPLRIDLKVKEPCP